MKLVRDKHRSPRNEEHLPDYVDSVRPSPFPSPVAYTYTDDFETKSSPKYNERNKDKYRSNSIDIHFKIHITQRKGLFYTTLDSDLSTHDTKVKFFTTTLIPV